MSSRPFVVSPGEGETFRAGPFRIVSRVQGGQSSGSLEVYELTLGPSTIDYHVHRTMDETLCVLEGEIEFNLEGERFRRPSGSVAFAPRGVPHGFTNPGPGQARVLIVFNPAHDQHAYFRKLEALFAAPTLDVEALHALQREYDQELVAE